MVASRKGARRIRLDALRVRDGEPKANWKKNRELNCHFPKDGKATRKRGRNRFKTGKKRQRQRSVKVAL